VVFINSQDAKAAQNFTIAHELAHIWIGESGISNTKMGVQSSQDMHRIELFCNQVAAEFLVPAQEFNRIWDENQNLWANVRRISSVFKVSSLVVLLRAYENDAIQYPAFRSAFDIEEDSFRAQARRSDNNEPRDSQGGQFWNSFPWRVSHLFGKALVRDVRRDRTTYSEAARLLGISVSAFETFYHQEGGG
jgi:Zn-dependent peptidase ImmA (M78 family)